MPAELPFSVADVLAINAKDETLPDYLQKQGAFETLASRIEALNRQRPLGIYLGEVYPYVMLGGDDTAFKQFCFESRDKAWRIIFKQELPKLQVLKSTHAELFTPGEI